MKKVFSSLAVTATALAILCAGITGCSQEAKKAKLLSQAKKDFEAGSYERAKIEYLNVMRMDTEAPEPYRALGLIWMEQGAPLRALPFLLKAKENDPSDLVVKKKIANAMLSISHFAEARKEVIDILKASPGDVDALFLLASSDRTPENRKETAEFLAAYPDKNNASFLVASANLALAQRDISAAQTLLQKAVDSDPKNPLPHLAVATVALLRKDIAAAGQELKTAAELSPPRASARLQYAQFLIETGHAAEAKEIYSAISKEAPDYIPAWDGLARLAFSAGDYKEATELLKNVFSRDPNNLNSRLLEAQIEFAKGDREKAASVLEQIDKTYPGMPAVKYQLARVYLLSNNPSKAVSALKQAVTAAPDFADAVILLGQLDLRSGNIQSVITSMQGLLRTQPTNKAAEVLLADALRTSGRIQDAEQVIRRQIARNPDSADSLFYLGVILRQQGKTADSRAAFEKARALAPDKTSILAQLVDLDLAENKPADAAARVQEQLQKTPDSAELLLLEGRIAVVQNDLPLAEQKLQKAIEIDPKLVPAYDSLVAMHMKAGNLAQAVAELEKLAKNTSDPTRALMLLGTARNEMKDYEKARDAYETLLAKNPEFIPALNNLAYIYSEQIVDLDKALDLARRAWKLRANDPVIADTLGWILYKKKNYAEALPYIQEAATKIPDNAEVQLHLGLAEYMMGNEQAARAALERAVAGPDFPGKATAAEKLAVLKSSTDTVTLKDLQALAEKNPDDIIAKLHLGAALEQKGDSAAAAGQYESALQINAVIPTAVARLARLYSGPLNDKAKAEEYAKKARDFAQDDSATGAILGEVAFQNREFDRAYSLLREGLRNSPDSPELLLAYANAAYSLGNVEEARSAMERLQKASQDPKMLAEAQQFLSLASASNDNPEALEAEASKVLQADPNNVAALLVIGSAQAKRNENQAAEATLRKALDIYPQSALAQKALASLKVDTAINEANELAMKARKSRPNDMDVAFLLAEISARRKEYRYSLQLLDEIARSKPLGARELYLKGLCQFNLKQTAESRKSLELALSAGLGGSDGDDARKLLSTMDKK
jgi:tetratricopeptide (TPR) repeat protein